MSIQVHITGGGLKRLHTKLENQINFLGSGAVRSVLKEAADDLVSGIKDNIDSFTPGAVADLAPSTKKQKMRKFGRIYPVLKATGEMMESMYSYVRKKGVAGWAIGIRFKGIRNKEVAQHHIDGGPNLPRRDFMKLPRGFSAGIIAQIRAGLRSVK